jgi:hypothetical protein
MYLTELNRSQKPGIPYPTCQVPTHSRSESRLPHLAGGALPQEKSWSWKNMIPLTRFLETKISKISTLVSFPKVSVVDLSTKTVKQENSVLLSGPSK